MIDIIWQILGAITIILLILFWWKKNAVWGSFTLGIIIGSIIAIFFLFKGSGFNWSTIGKGAISGALLGFVAEILWKVSDFIKRKQ